MLPIYIEKRELVLFVKCSINIIIELLKQDKV